MAVVAAGELHHQPPPGEAPGQPQRRHGGLGAGADQPDPLDRGAARRVPRPGLTSPSVAVPNDVPSSAAARTASTTGGLACPRIIGPHEQTRSTYRLPSASVRYGPLPGRHEHRRPAYRAERPDRRVHPARDHGAGAGEQRVRRLLATILTGSSRPTSSHTSARTSSRRSAVRQRAGGRVPDPARGRAAAVPGRRRQDVAVPAVPAQPDHVGSMISGSQSRRHDHHSSSSAGAPRVRTKKRARFPALIATGPGRTPARSIRASAAVPTCAGTSSTSNTRPVTRITFASGVAFHGLATWSGFELACICQAGEIGMLAWRRAADPVARAGPVDRPLERLPGG